MGSDAAPRSTCPRRWSTLSDDSRRRYLDWWRGENEEPVLIVTCWDGAPAPEPAPSDRDHWFDFPSRFSRELYAIEHTLYFGDAFPFLFLNFGPGVLGAAMGGDYHFDRHTFWFVRPVLESLSDVERCRSRDDNPYWRAVVDYTDYALQHAAGRCLVSLTDIGGGMDVLAGLRGTQQLLMDVVDDPAGVRSALAVVYEEWWRMFSVLADRVMEAQAACVAWNGLYAPRPSYIFQNDFSCMMAPAQFAGLDVPFLADLSSRMDYAMYHLDGTGALGHADALCGVEGLRAIQWVPGAGAPEGVSHWLPLFRRIREVGKSLEVFAGPTEVPRLLSELGPRGLLIKTFCSTPAEAERLVATVRKG